MTLVVCVSGWTDDENFRLILSFVVFSGRLLLAAFWNMYLQKMINNRQFWHIIRCDKPLLLLWSSLGKWPTETIHTQWTHAFQSKSVRPFYVFLRKMRKHRHTSFGRSFDGFKVKLFPRYRYYMKSDHSRAERSERKNISQQRRRRRQQEQQHQWYYGDKKHVKYLFCFLFVLFCVVSDGLCDAC